jgi:hydroxymethylpyrimidine pyrophosphatase-like HAD family hydrolase
MQNALWDHFVYFRGELGGSMNMHLSSDTAAGLFATDMDGTLLPSNGEFDHRDMRALELLGGKGIVRVIATGRSPFSLRRMLGDRELPVDYLVLSSGAGIMDYSTGEFLRILRMEAHTSRRLAGILEGMGFDYCIQNAIPNNHVFTYRFNSVFNPDLQRRIDIYEGHCSPLESSNDIGPSTQALIVIPPHKWEDEHLPVIRESLGDSFNVLRTTSPLDGESVWIEIFPVDVSKSSGVRWLARKHGLTSDDVAAVGNDYNDHDLLQWAGHAFVVADSPQHLRSSFREVPPVGRGGVAEAARLWLVEIGQLPGEGSWPDC